MPGVPSVGMYHRLKVIASVEAETASVGACGIRSLPRLKVIASVEAETLPAAQPCPLLPCPPQGHCFRGG